MIFDNVIGIVQRPYYWRHHPRHYIQWVITNEATGYRLCVSIFIHYSAGKVVVTYLYTLIAKFMGPTWGPSGADRTQVGLMLAPWTLLSWYTISYGIYQDYYQRTYIDIRSLESHRRWSNTGSSDGLLPYHSSDKESHTKWRVKLLIHFPNSTVARLKFGNE